MKKLAVPVLAALGAVGFVVSIYLVFMATPLEYGIEERTDGPVLGRLRLGNRLDSLSVEAQPEAR
jgi:hypothetical protein